MNHNDRMQLASLSLEGLSIGDAFGERFFKRPEVVENLIHERAFPKAPWNWTDDTAMAISVVNVLFSLGKIDSSVLAKAFAKEYVREPDRGYARGAQEVLSSIASGESWIEAASTIFEGQGSFGNGGAMRSAPIGAYFWDDYDVVARHAAASAAPTHYHPEGSAGAVAIAVAAAYATRLAVRKEAPKENELIERVLEHCPEGETRNGIVKSLTFGEDAKALEVAAALGNGSGVSAQDTVPFCIWSANRNLENFEGAMWETVSVLGDRDTTCAIVGGIIAPYLGLEKIPLVFRESREALPEKETLLF